MTLKALRTLALLLALVLGGASPGAWLTVHSTTQSEQSTRWWAWAYGINPDYLWHIAECESSGDPYAINPSGAVGLFQFKPATYVDLMARLNADPTLAPNLTSYDPEYRFMEADEGAAEAHVASWAIHAGYGYLWQCR
jgi:soluble lytic murein transglycosylase-like protein